MKNYEYFEENERFKLKKGKTDVLIMCCSCGLVHHYFFEVDGNYLIINPERSNIRTAWARKKRQGDLLDGSDDKWMMIKK